MLGICSLNVLVLHETLLVLVLKYDSETVLWKEKERSRIRADNPRGWVGSLILVWNRKLCRVKKGLDEGVL